MLVLHPKKIRDRAKARIKFDRVDPKVLAELLRLDLLPERFIPSEKLAELWESPLQGIPNQVADQARDEDQEISLRMMVSSSTHAVV